MKKKDAIVWFADLAVNEPDKAKDIIEIMKMISELKDRKGFKAYLKGIIEA